MKAKRTRRPRRKRIGRVSCYLHHGAWWVYYKDGDRQVRRRTGPDEEIAEAIAAQVNAQLATAAPTMFSFTPLLPAAAAANSSIARNTCSCSS
jgi:integrase